MANKKSPGPAPISQALSDFDALPDSANVRVKKVAKLYDVSVVTVWRWAKNGTLPAPTKRGGVTSWGVGALRRHKTPTAA